MLEPGETVPSCALPNQDGAKVDLGSLRGKWALIFWYPKADTPGCTAQAQGLRDQQEAFDDLGCQILGISFDSVDAIAMFRSKLMISFDLLSDENREAGIAFGVAGEDGEQEYATRASFLVDPTGHVARSYLVDDPALHAEDVLDDLENLQ